MNSNHQVNSNCMACYNGETLWNICQTLTCNHISDLNYAVLILNRPITQNSQYVMQLWNNATVRITVDGGTRRWDNFLNDLPKEEQIVAKLPHLVTGDFDSITEEILQKYKSKGCKIIHTPDQNATDFTKALIQLNVHCREKDLEVDTVIVLGQTSGRMDQIMGNIQTLFLCKQKHLLPLHVKVYIMSDDTLTWLLPSGRHCINIPQEIRNHKKPWCSLVPIGQKCDHITTTGLKWNLDDCPLEFGSIVSTSNTYNGDSTVTISCSHPVLWSMKVPNLTGL